MLNGLWHVDDIDRVVVLAGRDYTERIREGLAEIFDGIVYPFEETSGIGEQMQPLSKRDPTELPQPS